MVRINDQITIPDAELRVRAVRSSGPGGQNVNKLSTAVHLRFDLHSSSLPARVRDRLLQSGDQRITAEGVVVIKAQNHRTLERNRAEALERLRQLIDGACREPRKRIRTRPTQASRRKRLDEKKKRGQLKKLRARDFD
jgi:ribosome-associated protein